MTGGCLLPACFQGVYTDAAAYSPLSSRCWCWQGLWLCCGSKRWPRAAVDSQVLSHAPSCQPAVTAAVCWM